jgi:hypothetical protein
LGAGAAPLLNAFVGRWLGLGVVQRTLANEKAPMNTRRNLLALPLALVPSWLAAQVRLEGYTFEPRVRVADAELVLNGAGLRQVAWFKGFAAALYLPSKAASPEQALASPGAKRLQMRMLHDVPAEEFVKAFDKGVFRNTPAAALPLLRERMAEFVRQVRGVGTVRKADLINLDFIPRIGLQFTLNGRPRGNPIAGEDLYAALLRVFLGEQPVDAKLKQTLLGQPAA